MDGWTTIVSRISYLDSLIKAKSIMTTKIKTCLLSVNLQLPITAMIPHISIVIQRGDWCERRDLDWFPHGARADLSNGGKTMYRLQIVFSVELSPCSSVSVHFHLLFWPSQEEIDAKGEIWIDFLMELEQTFPMVVKSCAGSNLSSR